jgi:Lon protease-like protein
MAAFHPGLEDLPREIGVFPLPGALLLPQGKLPLNIFERRYLNLVEDALGQGRMFGMVQPDPGQPAGETGPALFKVGCLGRLSSYSESEDGRFLITLTGVIRFRVAAELPLARLHRVVGPDYSGFEADLNLVARAPLADRASLLAALRGFFRARSIEANWSAVEQTPDAELLTTLCMVCPFEPREKQALLEVASPHERARLLLALLLMGGQAGAHNDPPPGSKPS